MKYLISKFLDSSLRTIGIKSINGQFMLSYLVIFLFAALTVLSLYFTMSASAETINVAGRQRMLSQRLAKEALMVAQKVEQRAVLEKTMLLFESSHQKLLLGDAASRLVAPATPEIKDQLEHVGTLWKEYKKIVNDYLGESSKDNLQRLHKMSPTVLKEMNKVVMMMAAASNADLRWQQLFAMIMAAGILITVLISRFFGMDWLMGQIHLAKERLDAVRNGDFSKKITAEYSDNEIGEIFDAYNSMLEQVGGIVTGVQQLSDSVSAQTSQLTQSVNMTEQSVQTQNGEIDMVATAMNEMSATVGEVARNATQAAESAGEADQAAQNGQKVVDSTMGYIKNVASELSGAVSVMQQLDSDSQEIGNVLTVITGIADQTNLLALNAAIEAARAGEQGRGFAVVADEVRTLARRTQESTEEIQKIIERLQTQSNKAVAVMESSTQQAQESANQATEVDSALQHIVTAVDAISQMNTQIATAAEEQSQVAQEMDRNITNISTATHETAQVATDVRGGTETINSQVQQLHDLVANLKVQD